MYRQILAQQTKENQKKIWRDVNEMRECGRETLWQEGFDAEDTDSVLRFTLIRWNIIRSNFDPSLPA